MTDQQRTFESEVLIPAVQTFLTGLILGTGAAFLAWLTTDKYLEWGIAVGTISLMISWLRLLARSWRVVETVLGVDLNQDGIIGTPEPEPQRMILHVRQIDGKAEDILELPISDAQFTEVSQLLVNGSRFSHADLAGRGKPLTRSQYESLRNELQKRGWVTWKDDRAPTQGLRVTSKGMAPIREYAARSPAAMPHVKKK